MGVPIQTFFALSSGKLGKNINDFSKKKLITQ